MQRLRHENIVRIVANFPTMHGSKIIVMEYVQEGSLDCYLRANKDRIKYPSKKIWHKKLDSNYIVLWLNAFRPNQS